MRIDDNHWLKSKPIAHRGLWGNKVVENSLTAYEKAAIQGLPIEIDLYMTTDKELVTFHDKTLNRMTGENGFIYEKSLAELKSLSLGGTAEKIPTLNEVLEIAKDRSPLLIELKNQPNDGYVDQVIKILNDYKGEFAVQSFNPFFINRIIKVAPQFIRGILGTHQHAKEENFLTRYVLKHLPFNGIIKPDFISYDYEGLKYIEKKRGDLTVLCWTVTEKSVAENLKGKVDNIIFENFLPDCL